MHSLTFAVLVLTLPGQVALPEVTDLRSREMRFPFKVALNEADSIARFRLFVSEDQGKTWTQAAVCGPEERAFRFTAKQDGFYWFAVQTEYRDGTRQPPRQADLSESKVRKVQVDTSGK